MRVHRALAVMAAAMAASPALAQEAWVPQPVPAAERLTFGAIFGDASAANQAVMAGLLLAAVAAVALWAAGLARARSETPSGAAGMLAFLAGLKSAAPLIALAGASYTLVGMTVALANARNTPPVSVLAPGFAEAALQVLIGLLAASIAVVCHRHLDMRLRRILAEA